MTAVTDVVMASTTAAKRLGYDSLKDKQMDVIISVVKGEDVFGVLPTGYGKSLCYACLPWVFDNLYPIEKPSVVIVVSPLTAIRNYRYFICSVYIYTTPTEIT